ncbi:MAG: CCA tRNA nucleotidyltransferase [Dehalococcoidia bacterium]|nr:CCA tRNA nucleotidyltransferase [Dehalococcoidia bacterium]
MLAPICAEARNAGLSLYLVGGPVRDLLLEKPVKDLDLVVEGDAQTLASTLAARLEGRLVARSQFGTAALRLGKQSLDLVTARRETYPRPGALPQVTPSSIEDDLARRDFTINAMALPLTGPAKGGLLDPHGGRADLSAGVIRVLHHASFIDDPTRVLRALRYEQRLGYRLDEATERRLMEALDTGAMDTLSGDRLRKELSAVLREAEPHRALRRCAELAVLTAIHPAMGNDSAVAALAGSGEAFSPLEYLAALSFPSSKEQGMSLVHRLRMPATWKKVVEDTAAVRLDVAPNIAGGPDYTRSALYLVLEPYAPEALRVNAIMAEDPAVGRALKSYLDDMRYVKPLLKGGDLVSIGFPQGPLVGDALRELQSARLDGLVTTRDDEIKTAEGYLASRRAG